MVELNQFLMRRIAERCLTSLETAGLRNLVLWMNTTVLYAHCFNPKHVALEGEGERFFKKLDNLQ
jgi:hypothetical protein